MPRLHKYSNLTADDRIHYQEIIVALSETIGHKPRAKKKWVGRDETQKCAKIKA